MMENTSTSQNGYALHLHLAYKVVLLGCFIQLHLRVHGLFFLTKFKVDNQSISYTKFYGF